MERRTHGILDSGLLSVERGLEGIPTLRLGGGGVGSRPRGGGPKLSVRPDPELEQEPDEELLKNG